MYSTCLFKGRRAPHNRAGLLARSLMLISVTVAAQGALAAETVPELSTMQYASAGGFSTSKVNFDLLAVDSGLDADCDPLLSAGGGADSGSSGSDGSLLLAKLDSDPNQKPSQPPVRASKKKAASDAAASKAATSEVSTPQVDAKPIEPTWEIIMSDKTLNAAMARWAAQAGWQLVWELPVDYAVEARTTVHGTFEEAVTMIAKSMENAEIPMKAVFYQGNKVLRIMSKGGE